jgi:Spy/CpxP family protein refolding chaperone
MLARWLLAVVLIAGVASAQRGNRGGGGTDEMPRPQKRESKFDLFADKLKLTKEQKDEAMNIVKAAAEESQQVRQDLDKSRVAMATAFIDGKSGDELKKPMDDYTAAAAQMTGIEAKAFGKVLALLKPNQQSKAGPAFEALADIFDRPAPGGGGRNGGERTRP